MGEIKAIETEYKGYRFRSRLEARWAVFFETLGCDWAYEPEGFELKSGRYLPDFKVKEYGWLEVKPDRKEIPEYDWVRLLEFQHAVETSYVVPAGSSTFGGDYPERIAVNNHFWILDGLPAPVPYCRPTALQEQLSKKPEDRFGDLLWHHKSESASFWWADEVFEGAFGPQYLAACKAAKSARF